MSYPEPDPTLAFVYDGTLEGLLCSIFETYARKQVPLDIVTEKELRLRLGQEPHTVATSPFIAERVKTGIARTCGAETYEAVRAASLSDDRGRGIIIARFVRHSMAAKRSTLNQRAHPQVEPFIRIHHAVLSERHRMMQFLRFQELEGGFWFARCHPQANVVPLLMDWFAERFNVQPFVIYDEGHHLAGVYQGHNWFLVETDELDLPDPTTDEHAMARAWQRFYKTASIEARLNPELRRSFMPKRLWEHITELADEQ